MDLPTPNGVLPTPYANEQRREDRDIETAQLHALAGAYDELTEARKRHTAALLEELTAWRALVELKNLAAPRIGPKRESLHANGRAHQAPAGNTRAV